MGKKRRANFDRNQLTIAGTTPTHADLVEAGRQWLLRRRAGNLASGRRSRGVCSVVLTEMVTQVSETPDVLGWYGGVSIVIEAKASRADFLADRKKSFRRHPENGLGQFRYYIAPKAMITASELPDGWGLIEVSGDDAGRVRVARESQVFSARHDNEVAVLISLVRRLDVEPGKHVSIMVYVKQSPAPAATATIEPVPALQMLETRASAALIAIDMLIEEKPMLSAKMTGHTTLGNIRAELKSALSVEPGGDNNDSEVQGSKTLVRQLNEVRAGSRGDNDGDGDEKKIVIYAWCHDCERHFILEDMPDALGDYPCMPCPECSSSHVDIELKPNIVLGLAGRPLTYISGGKRNGQGNENTD